LRAQAHKISEQVHDINLFGMSAEAIGKVNEDYWCLHGE